MGDNLTAMFMHASIAHIFGNMLFLAIFGPTVEDAMGRLRFPIFYILGGLAALGAQILIDPASPRPRSAPRARSPPCWAATSCSIRERAC